MITRIGTLELRPWSMVTQEAIEALSLAELSVPRQALAVAYLQSIPAREVRESLERGTLRAEVESFSDEAPLAWLQPIVDWCTRETQVIAAARVDVVPQHKPDPKAPGN